MNARLAAARIAAAASAAMILFALVGCSDSDKPETPAATSAAPARAAPPPTAEEPRRELASDPVRIADDLVADERALRDPSSTESLKNAAAQRQQLAYRAIGRHPEWDPIVRPRIPPELGKVYDHNVHARRELGVMSRPKDTLPAWRIVAPTPVDQLMTHYREAESEFGVPWHYLAAINLVETAFGRVAGVSTAGAQGPMQFMPSTFAAFGAGGDIHSPRDSIMAAGRYLSANGFTRDRDYALYRYNNSNNYVRAIHDYAAVMAADPAGFDTYYRWEVYYLSTAGDVLLPVGYAEANPILAVNYLAAAEAPAPDVFISEQNAQILERMLTARNGGPPPELAEVISRAFLGTPYGAHTLVGSASEPEQLVVELSKVDCFTYADYVEALKRAGNRDEFIAALIDVRYKDGVVAFANRKHFFTDWAAATPAVATDITTSLSTNAIPVQKNLNQKDSGGVYLPGLPVVPRTVSYVPSAQFDSGVVSGLRTGDYIGAYSEDGGLDVTHVGIFVDTPNGPVLRNASSLPGDNKVVDTPLFDYVPTVPGVVVLRPVQ
ncbi:lytic transglycosylase [Mycobacterium sp. 852014-52144_SCH5372336]|nr:lytic transglycosylase [Mycobacterium sp. 852014-52144_SCH5372336]